MEIIKDKQQGTLKLSFSGRLDTTTAPMFEQVINEDFGDVTDLIVDFENLEYVSSAGLRMLLTAHKAMAAKKGSMVIKNANDGIKEVFEMTGFNDILNLV